jgi:hypothetical protein
MKNLREAIRKIVRQELQEWKIKTGGWPTEAQPLVDAIRQALQSGIALDIEVLEIEESKYDVYSANILIYNPDYPSEAHIVLDTIVEIINYPEDPDYSVGYGGSNGSIRIKPNNIIIEWDEEQLPYVGKDTTDMVNLVNKNYPYVYDEILSRIFTRDED